MIDLNERVKYWTEIIEKAIDENDITRILKGRNLHVAYWSINDERKVIEYSVLLEKSPIHEVYLVVRRDEVYVVGYIGLIMKKQALNVKPNTVFGIFSKIIGYTMNPK